MPKRSLLARQVYNQNNHAFPRLSLDVYVMPVCAKNVEMPSKCLRLTP